MKKRIVSLLLAVLVVPGLAQAQDTQEPRRAVEGRDGVKLERVAGKIVSLSANTVTIATRAKSNDDKAKHVKVQISAKPELRDLFAKGLGQKAQLFCRKTDKGGLVIVRVRSIEGVEVPEQGRQRPGMMGQMRHGGEELSPEQLEKRRERFGAMREHFRENPELRKELRELAQSDPEAFGQRIRQMHEDSGTASGARPRGGFSGRKTGQPGRDGARPGPARQRGGRDGARPGPAGQRGGRGMDRLGNPQIAKLEQQSQELAKRYQKAQGQDKEELDEKLRDTLTEAFELKVQAQGKQVQHLEKQLDRLRKQLEKREQSREAMIQKRFSQLTGQEDELSW